MSDYEDNAPDLSKIDWDDNEVRAPIKTGAVEKVDLVSDLIRSISTKKNIGGLKKQLKTVKQRKFKTLDAPVHRQAQRRIQSAVALKETKKDLQVWNDVIRENRGAEQIVYPHNREDVEALQVERASDKAQAFKPRTDFEKKMADLLGTSKNHLTNDTEYTEAEKEILKAMSLKEAREKTDQLRKLRFLTSQKESKFHRQKKIKSKTYHKIKKRQQRREAIKEFEELVVKDPAAAQEKLDRLDTDRAYERAALRHRGQNKWSKELRQFASRNPEVKTILADHLKFHRELKKKHGGEAFASSDEEDDDGPKLTIEDVMKMAADQAAREAAGSVDKEIDSVEKNPWLKSAAAQLRSKKVAAATRTMVNEATNKPSEPDFLLVDFERPANTVVKEKSSETPITPSKSVKKKEKEDELHEDDDEESDIQSEDSSDSDSSVEFVNIPKKTASKSKVKKPVAPIVKKSEKSAKASEGKGKKKPKQAVQTEDKPDIDLKTYLEVNAVATNELPDNVNEAMEEDSDVERDNILAEAFADDDVVDDFEEKKKRIEEDENPLHEEDDIRQMGWGSWTGPGIVQRKPEKRKIKEASTRKDGKRAHVIIRENVKNTIEDLQPRFVPFPFKRAGDYEALMQQPIGRDWNLVKNTTMMVRPEVVAPAGRIIRPMDRSVLKMETAAEMKEEEDDEVL